MKRLLTVLLGLLVMIVSVHAQETTEEPILTRTAAPTSDSIRLEMILDELWRPLFITHANDQTGRLFVVEQGGRIYAIDNDGQHLFLDLSSIVTGTANFPTYTEHGLLGLAFHPNYAENGYFFVNYTDRGGDTNVVRYTVSDDPIVADPNSAHPILFQEQPYVNHKGGHMAFGDDGYLYIAFGDGGSQGDPLATGQNPTDWLGSILRIDVNTEIGYAIPADNPFADGVGGAPEVWAYGFRNPWRFSFDRITGDLYIGDVGQNQWEEINFEPAIETGGLNYGWNVFEGTHAYSGAVASTPVVPPVAEYAHNLGCSVSGGYVYRGSAIPDLQGAYLYGDFCTGIMWSAYRDIDGNWQSSRFLDTGFQISSFGEDETGELYIINYSGAIYAILPAE